MEKRIKNIILHIALIILLGSGVYANSLHGQFICDDVGLVQNNDYIKNGSNVLNMLTENMGAGSGTASHYNRPLPMMTYAMDYSLWRLHVVGYHLSNLALHFAVALCIYWLIMLLFHESGAAFLTSLYFMVHPINTEAASYISGRADSLVFLFMLLSLIFYVKSLFRKDTVLFTLSLLACLLSILSKENSIILPLLVLLCHYLLKQKIDIRRFLVLSSLFAGYLFLKLDFLTQLMLHGFSQTTISSRAPGFFVAVTEYLRILFLPFGLHFEYGDRTFTFHDPRAALGLLLSVVLISIAFYHRKNHRTLSFAIGWFFVGLLPVTNIFPVIHPYSFMMGHWVYVSSLGFFIIMARLACAPFTHRWLRISLRTFVTGALVCCSLATVRENTFWRDPVVFYEHSLTYTPDNWRFCHNLALNYADRGDIEKAIGLYKKTLEMNPRAVSTYYNLGELYRRMGKNEDALRLYASAGEINPDPADAYYMLGTLFSDIGRAQDAAALYKKAIEINPNHVFAYCRLGDTYRVLGREEAKTTYDKAIVLTRQALEIAPGYASLYSQLAHLYEATGQNNEVIGLYQKAVMNHAEYFDAYYHIGNLYSDAGNHIKAIKMYRKAVEIDPGSGDAYSRLGRSYGALGRNKEAALFLKKALELNQAK